MACGERPNKSDSSRDSRARYRAGEVGGSRRVNLISSESKMRKASTDVGVCRILNSLKAGEDRLVSPQLGLLRCAGMKGGQRVLTSKVDFDRCPSFRNPSHLSFPTTVKVGPESVQSINQNTKRPSVDSSPHFPWTSDESSRIDLYFSSTLLLI